MSNLRLKDIVANRHNMGSVRASRPQLAASVAYQAAISRHSCGGVTQALLCTLNLAAAVSRRSLQRKLAQPVFSLVKEGLATHTIGHALVRICLVPGPEVTLGMGDKVMDLLTPTCCGGT
jgi:hypothetical protein